MDSFELQDLLLEFGFTEYWHPGNYDKTRVKALGYSHPKYGVVYLKRDPLKPNKPQVSFPLVINGGYENKIKALGENCIHLACNRDRPAFYNTNLRGFPSRLNPEYKGKKTNPLPTAYGIDFNVVTRDGLNRLLTWLENPTAKVEISNIGVSHDSKTDDERVIREIKTRRGQPEFRQKLLTLFKGKCCVTGCNVESVLEAAHVIPHAEDTDYSEANGLLLRADIHTLFDLNLLGIDEHGIVHVHDSLKNSEYESYQDQVIVENLNENLALNLKVRFSLLRKQRN